MKKVLVLGCCGAGKSTFSRKLHVLTNLPVIHLDHEYWSGKWQPTPKTEWESKINELLKYPTWIMDGNYGGTLDARMVEADSIIFLQYPTYLCMYRVLKRIWKYRGRVRPDMKDDCRERFDLDFLHYVLVFNLIKTPKIVQKLDSYKNRKRIFIFRNDRQAESFLEKLSSQTKPNAGG